MKLIEEFEYVKGLNDKTGEFIFTKGIIKKEVSRSIINFYNSEGKFIEMHPSKHKIYWQTLFGYGDFKNILTVKELEFVAKTYGINTVYDDEGDLKATLKDVHPNFLPGLLKFFEVEGKEYLVISFDRKSEYLPPQAGEDITYYLGIWENPLLTDEIIEKIKQP